MNRIYILSILLFFLNNLGCDMKINPLDYDISIIPVPEILTVENGEFTVKPGTAISFDKNNKQLEQVVDYFIETMKTETELELSKNSTSAAGLHLEIIKSDELGQEGYQLKIDPDEIIIKANSEAGIFYGVQSLRQLIINRKLKSPESESVSLQCLSINDTPRFGYRGMHLDVCRHFMPKEFVKKYIDYLALHKMNKFHWHLTEDQGWRIEIKKYPELTRISSYRDETLVGHFREKPRKYDGKKHGGYYSQEDIREIVKYAETRFVEIIPEIEMPGHSVAALAAYPDLSCTGGPFEVATIWGIFKDVYCAGKEETFTFLQNVLTEVIELFPSKYIHIGGDECRKIRWEHCPDCQTRIKAEGLANEEELQSYFIKRIEKFLNSKGKKLIGWDEILEGGLAPDATVMSWRGIKGGVEAANQGHDVIMTPNSHLYFDYYQGDRETEPLAIGGDLSLEKVYSYEPVPDTVTAENRKHILGAQANVWTEYIPTPEHVEYMAMPRMAALAEIVWSPPANKNYENFKARLNYLMKLYKKLGINYSKSHLNK